MYEIFSVYSFAMLEMLVVQWLSLKETDTATQVQILDEAVCISHTVNTSGKGMNSTIFPPGMGK